MCLRVILGRTYFILLRPRESHQSWKTSNKNYFGIYLFFISLHIFGDFLSFSLYLLHVFLFLISSFQLGRRFTVLIRWITIAGYWTSFMNHHQEIVVWVVFFYVWGWQESGRERSVFAFSSLWACTSHDQENTNCSTSMPCPQCQGWAFGNVGKWLISAQYGGNIVLQSFQELLPSQKVKCRFCVLSH